MFSGICVKYDKSWNTLQIELGRNKFNSSNIIDYIENKSEFEIKK